MVKRHGQRFVSFLLLVDVFCHGTFAHSRSNHPFRGLSGSGRWGIQTPSSAPTSPPSQASEFKKTKKVKSRKISPVVDHQEKSPSQKGFKRAKKIKKNLTPSSNKARRLVAPQSFSAHGLSSQVHTKKKRSKKQRTERFPTEEARNGHTLSRQSAARSTEKYGKIKRAKKEVDLSSESNKSTSSATYSKGILQASRKRNAPASGTKRKKSNKNLPSKVAEVASRVNEEPAMDIDLPYSATYSEGILPSTPKDKWSELSSETKNRKKAKKIASETFQAASHVKEQSAVNTDPATEKKDIKKRRKVQKNHSTLSTLPTVSARTDDYAENTTSLPIEVLRGQKVALGPIGSATEEDYGTVGVEWPDTAKVSRDSTFVVFQPEQDKVVEEREPTGSINVPESIDALKGSRHRTADGSQEENELKEAAANNSASFDPVEVTANINHLENESNTNPSPFTGPSEFSEEKDTGGDRRKFLDPDEISGSLRKHEEKETSALTPRERTKTSSTDETTAPETSEVNHDEKIPLDAGPSYETSTPQPIFERRGFDEQEQANGMTLREPAGYETEVSSTIPSMVETLDPIASSTLTSTENNDDGRGQLVEVQGHLEGGVDKDEEGAGRKSSKVEAADSSMKDIVDGGTNGEGGDPTIGSKSAAMQEDSRMTSETSYVGNSSFGKQLGIEKQNSIEDPYLDADVVHFIGRVLDEDIEEVRAWTNAESSSNTDGGNTTIALNETRGGSQAVLDANTTNMEEDVVHSPVENALDGVSIQSLGYRTVAAEEDESSKLAGEGVVQNVTLTEDNATGGVEMMQLSRSALESSEDKKTDAIVSVVTWNLAEESPSEEDAQFIRAFRSAGIKSGTGSDLVLISGQECENIKPRRTEGRRSREFRRLMIKMLGKDYVPIGLHLLGGIQFGLFAKKSFLKEIEDVTIADVTCGIGNVFHNKGAIAAFVKVKARNPRQDDSSSDERPRSKSLRMVFVTAHMAAHVKNSDARDADFWRISSELGAQAPDGFLPSKSASTLNNDRSFLFDSVDRAFFCGDLNYRVDLPREAAEFTILTGDPRSGLVELMRHDQLFRSMTEGRAFPGFVEGQITFAPTFKFDKETGDYDTSHKQRIPAWTDRILFKALGTRVLSYTSVPEAQHSDHRPVVGTFRVNMEGREVPPTNRRRMKQSNRDR